MTKTERQLRVVAQRDYSSINKCRTNIPVIFHRLFGIFRGVCILCLCIRCFLAESSLGNTNLLGHILYLQFWIGSGEINVQCVNLGWMIEDATVTCQGNNKMSVMTAENVMLLFGFSSYLPFLQRRDVTDLVLPLALSIVRVLPLLTFAYSVVIFPNFFPWIFPFFFSSRVGMLDSRPTPFLLLVLGPAANQQLRPRQISYAA